MGGSRTPRKKLTRTQLPVRLNHYGRAVGTAQGSVDRPGPACIDLHRIDEGERHQAAITMNRRLSELAAYTPLYYQSDVLVPKGRLSGPFRLGLNRAGVTWNIFAWEVTG